MIVKLIDQFHKYIEDIRMKNKTNLLLDVGVFAALLIVMEPDLTGIAIHEWLSLAVAGTIIVHLLLHWKWITTVAVRYSRTCFIHPGYSFWWMLFSL
jgi:cytochrome b